MSDNEKDPPLADKPKVSSLTDFEIKALKLQKEGKGDEVQKEIERRGLIKEVKEEEQTSQAGMTEEEMRSYDQIRQSLNNPITMDQVPPKYRAEIEEGISLLKSILDDNERLEELRKVHKAAFEKSGDASVIKKPVLPPELMMDPVEDKSGDVPIIVKKEEEKPAAAEAPSAPQKPNTENPADKLTFINDISSPAKEAMKPKEEPVNQQQNFAYDPMPNPPDPKQTISILDNCPHCGWDLKKTDLTEPSDDDKYDFVQSILGNIRFKKVYDMFDGKYKVVFRALTSKESDMAFRQIVLDGQRDFQDRALAGTDFYWRNLQAYRMVMSLESITSVEYGTLEIPTLAEADLAGVSGKDSQARLIPFLNYVLDTFLPLESTRSVIGHAYFEFQSLCDKLQVMAESPNFWKAIA
jgi:hypothetical protein